MNLFIYDSFLNQKKYDRLLARLETRITDLGLNGKISRLSLMRNVAETVNYELKRGAKTIIAVGNNVIVNQIANVLAGGAVPLAVIPVGEENNEIARGLGIASPEAACDILAARLLARLDLGQANGVYFLGQAVIPSQGTVIDMNKNFTIEASDKGLIRVVNLAGAAHALPAEAESSPQDGILELVIDPAAGKKLSADGQSLFKIKKVALSNQRAPLLLDGSVEIPTPTEISLAKQALNVIVGKNRQF